MSRIRYLVVPVFALGVLALSACGGQPNADKSATPTETVTKTASASPAATKSSQAKPITCDTIRPPQMEEDVRGWNAENSSGEPRVIAENVAQEGALRPKTHEFGGVDCVYGVVNGIDPVEYGASKITAAQRASVQAELEKQHFEKHMEGRYQVFSAEIPASGKKDPQAISFAFDDDRGMWFWATTQKEYAVLMANAYRG